MLMEEDSRRHLLNQDNWVNWPLQTVKKRTGKGLPDVGVVLAADSNWTVYDVNLFGLPKTPVASWPIAAKFATVDEMLAAGWEVD